MSPHRAPVGAAFRPFRLSVVVALAALIAGALAGGSGGTPSAANPIAYVYDESGRLVAVSDPEGDTAVYRFDAVGNLLSISRHSSASVSVIHFSPRSGPTGTSVTIYGTAFSTTASENTVAFNGVAASVTSATRTKLVATVRGARRRADLAQGETR